MTGASHFRPPGSSSEPNSTRKVPDAVDRVEPFTMRRRQSDGCTPLATSRSRVPARCSRHRRPMPVGTRAGMSRARPRCRAGASPQQAYRFPGRPTKRSAIHNGIRVWRPRIGSNGESGPVAVVCRRVVMVIGSARMIIVMDALLGNAASVPARMAPLLTRRKSLVDRGGPGGETQQPLPTLNEAPVGGHDVRTRAAPASAG